MHSTKLAAWLALVKHINMDWIFCNVIAFGQWNSVRPWWEKYTFKVSWAQVYAAIQDTIKILTRHFMWQNSGDTKAKLQTMPPQIC